MDFTSPALATVNALDHDKTYNYARVQEVAASTAADNMTAHGRYRRAREDSRPVNLLSEQAQADFQKFFQEMKRKYPLEYSLPLISSGFSRTMRSASAKFPRVIRRNPAIEVGSSPAAISEKNDNRARCIVTLLTM